MKKKYLILLVILIVGIILFVSLFSDDKQYKDWYQVNLAFSSDLNEDFVVIKTYDDAKKYIGNYENYNLDFKQNDYLLIKLNVDECSETINGIENIKVVDKEILVDINYDQKCGVCAPINYYYVIAVKKNMIDETMSIKYQYNLENASTCDPDIAYKPIIYLYPKEDSIVKVKLGYPDKIVTSYPKYNKEWNVYAKSNGDLIDLDTNKTYYGLYWEGINSVSKDVLDEGFVVENKDIVSFLEEKLEILGLNEREANEFIIYWLPKLEQYSYNYIYFESIEEINQNMPLDITPKPDTIIRVLMEFKGLDEKINVKEQELKTVIRDGFSVVEWGGTQIK